MSWRQFFTNGPADARAQDQILCALNQLKKETTAMFEDLRARVQKMTNAADGMDATLKDVKSRLDTLIANGGLSDADKAELQAISDGIDKEADLIVADTLANTPAASQAPAPVDQGTGTTDQA